MNDELYSQWTDIDRRVEAALVGDDPALDAAVRANSDAGLPHIDVAPVQGKLLSLLARSAGARRVLEVGTLGGYSTIWLARAVGENGRVLTLEYERQHAQVARANLDRAGVGERVEIRVGAALDTLRLLPPDTEPFDFVFVDADKPNNTNYVLEALRFSRPGTVIVVDNIVSSDGRDLLDLFARDARLDATALQTVGAKGHDGFAYALVTG